MRRLISVVAATTLVTLPAPLALAQDHVDLSMVTRIRMEGLERSQVMDTAWWLTDRFGPRLTGSTNLRLAKEWARDRLIEWGIENAELEEWGDFGRGWEVDACTVEMIVPSHMNIIAYPKAWTPSTDGVITGEPLLLELNSDEDFEKWRGKIDGRIVLVGSVRNVEPPFEPLATRRTMEQLEELAMAPEPGRRGGWGGGGGFNPGFLIRVRQFLVEENAAVMLEPDAGRRGDYGVIFVSRGGSHDLDGYPAPPSLVVSQEHYNRIARLIQREQPVELRVNVEARFLEDDPRAYNLIAEIPGTDPDLRHEIVMLGAHIDSWHAATGATDNGASSAVCMEAMRILHTLGVKPRRTIRMALWSGEEQGLLGSRNYVTNHFADRNTMELKSDHERLSVYFNLDNGAGKIRGIYTQNNPAVAPIFESWLKPFHDMGATTVTNRSTGSTDHVSFDAVGLPGFQFIQDPMDYSSRSHHTNMDLYDRIVPGDVMQASVVMAWFAYNAAMRDEMIPRKPLPEPRRRN